MGLLDFLRRKPSGAAVPSSKQKPENDVDRTNRGQHGREYTVLPGDSLSKIAREFYGDSNRWHQIYQANRKKIKNPNFIEPGEKLIIP